MPPRARRVQRIMNSGLPKISGVRNCIGAASTASAVRGEKASASVSANCAASGAAVAPLNST